MIMGDAMAFYRKVGLELLMSLVKKLSFFQKEPHVMIIVNKIGDADKSIVQFVQKFIAILVRVIVDYR